MTRKITKQTVINNLRKNLKSKNEELEELKKMFNKILFLIEGCNTEEKLNLLKEVAKKRI